MNMSRQRRLLLSGTALILVWNLATSFFRGKVSRDNPGTHGHSNGLHVAAAARKLCRIAPIRSRRPLVTWLTPSGRPDPIVGR